MSIGSTSPASSPIFVDGSISNLTPPETPYLPGYAEDRQMDLPNLDTSTPYTFAPNRPLSPTASTTSSSSSTMTSPFQFPFPDNPVPSDRPDFNFQRHSTNGAELTLHGGAAHISVVNNDERYQAAVPHHPENSPIIPPPNNTEIIGPDRENSEAEAYRYTPHDISRRETNSHSRSPSPTDSPTGPTLAAVKAQAFGALRRTRIRQKKGSEGTTKASLEFEEHRDRDDEEQKTTEAGR